MCAREMRMHNFPVCRRRRLINTDPEIAPRASRPRPRRRGDPVRDAATPTGPRTRPAPSVYCRAPAPVARAGARRAVKPAMAWLHAAVPGAAWSIGTLAALLAAHLTYSLLRVAADHEAIDGVEAVAAALACARSARLLAPSSSSSPSRTRSSV